VTPPVSQPVGDPGGKNWTLAFDDEFNGTSIDTSKWVNYKGWIGNGVTSSSADCTESGGNLVMSTPGNGTGCFLSSSPGLGAGSNAWLLRVGGYVEARIWFPGPGSTPTSTIDNWPAFWTLGATTYERGGEIDIAEVNTGLTVNYHSSSTNLHVASPPGIWGNSWHVYGVYRVSSTLDEVFWDGNMVGSFTPQDSGEGQMIIFVSGETSSCGGATCGGPTQYGPAGNVLVDWVHGWR
jgi:hypothetical protein